MEDRLYTKEKQIKALTKESRIKQDEYHKWILSEFKTIPKINFISYEKIKKSPCTKQIFNLETIIA